ncbi:MAG: CDP-diacylglycerol--glycerol-3-phosphate 3-phosphatidyltransferase [Spirochaeta sp.]
MNLPNMLTASRIVASPVLFGLFFLPSLFGVPYTVVVPLLWVLFLVMEVTDVLDGWVARRTGTVTDLGKVLDPYSDVISRITYFVAFTALGIMYPIFLLLIVYREVSILFVRMLMYRDGVALAARKGGKLKAVFYNISGVIGLVIFSVEGLDLFAASPQVYNGLRISAVIIFALATLLSWTSFLDYLQVFRKSRRERTNDGSQKKV